MFSWKAISRKIVVDKVCSLDIYPWVLTDGILRETGWADKVCRKHLNHVKIVIVLNQYIRIMEVIRLLILDVGPVIVRSMYR